jgi:hypothetical protein
MVHVEKTGIIFEDKRYAEKCWTHALEALVELADLKDALQVDCSLNAALFANWKKVKDWTEKSRYQQKTQAEAQELYGNITNDPDGVLPWIRVRW